MKSDYFEKQDNGSNLELEHQNLKPSIKFKHIQNKEMLESAARIVQFFLN